MRQSVPEMLPEAIRIWLLNSFLPSTLQSTSPQRRSTYSPNATYELLGNEGDLVNGAAQLCRVSLGSTVRTYILDSTVAVQSVCVCPLSIYLL